MKKKKNNACIKIFISMLFKIISIWYEQLHYENDQTEKIEKLREGNQLPNIGIQLMKDKLSMKKQHVLL